MDEDTATRLGGDRRRATGAELRTVRESLAGSGIALDDERATVVFLYPGLGVGENHPDLSGCTNQLLLLGAARARLGRLGIAAYAASTEPQERHEHLTALRRAIAEVTPEAAARLPHVDRPEGRYLRRSTMFIGGPDHGLLIENIQDSVAHTNAVIEALVTERPSD